MKSILIFVPDDLHMKFKIKLIEEGATIKETMLSFISLYVGEEKNVDKQKGKIEKDSKKNKA